MLEGLILGCAGTGKTLLLRRLQMDSVLMQEKKNKTTAALEVKEIDSKTSPTIGVEMEHLMIHKKQHQIREIGAAMLPMWPKYFEASMFLIYVVDLSNPLQLSESVIEFLNILRSKTIRSHPILLVLNKSDLPNGLSMELIKQYFCIDDLFVSLGRSFHVQIVSSLTGDKTNEILNWIYFSTQNLPSK